MASGDAQNGAPIEHGTPELSKYCASAGGGSKARSAARLTHEKLKYAATEINPAMACKLCRPGLAVPPALIIACITF